MRTNPYKFFNLILVWLGGAAAVVAMQITGYQAQVHDRFATGFPSAPVRNINDNFIGKDFDWTGVGWNSTNARVGYGFLSPRHHLLARHFTSNSSRRIHGQDDVVHILNHEVTVNLDLGAILESVPDHAVTRLTSAVPASAGLPRHPVLDLHSGSTTNSPTNYLNRDVFLYGHWGFGGAGSPRVAKTTISSVTATGDEHSFLTPNTFIQLEGNDSGSPGFLIWSDPDGNSELALVGSHAAVNTTSNIHNFVASHQVMAAINTVMAPDGHALRVVGEPDNTWVGSTNISIGSRRSWGVGFLGSAPSDRFVTFDGATAGGGREVAVDSNHNLRGLYFRNTSSEALGFQFTGASILTIGRGGIHNLDIARQVIDAPLALGDHQYWDAGAGGVAVQTLDTRGRLLNLHSPGPSVVRGDITGAGGIALEGGSLHLESATTYTGKTWVHYGTLRVDGDIRASESVVAGPAGVVTGHGLLPVLETSGTMMPDGILTAPSLAPGATTRFHFRIAAAVPDFQDPAGSANDVLRLTAAMPLASALTAGNTLAFFLSEMPPAAATSLIGGLFFDDPSATAQLVANATVQFFVADPEGGIDHLGQSYAPLAREATVGMIPTTANFPDGAVEGLAMRLILAPAPGSYAAWEATAFPTGTPAADRAPDASPFGDGVPNLLSYALALDPLATKFHAMPTATPGDDVLTFHFRRNLDAHDITLTVESSGDLVEWTAATMAPLVLDTDESVEFLEVPIALTPGETRRFARLRVVFATE